MARNIFNSVLLPAVKTNRFDLSHDLKLSFSMGELVPTACLEVLPGDKFEITVENMLRFAPLIAPVMHRVRVTTHFFFVPNRILWSEWEKWITGDSDVVPPTSNYPAGSALQAGTIADYLGYPTDSPAVTVKYSPFAMAAYRKIWDEYYRDQNLQTERFVPLVSGNNTAYEPGNNTAPYRRAWQHDYFTSALPWAQKGNVVQVPLTEQDNVPVTVDFPITGQTGQFKVPGTGLPSTAGAVSQTANEVTTGGQVGTYDPEGTMTVDIQAGATDINTLRRAFRIQEWLERNARGGTRYVENILSHFGVKSSDARLQRPEYIGGSKQNMVISEVLSTAQTLDTTDNIVNPVGNMSGHGISVGGGNTFSYRAEEHGWIIGIISVMPDTAYQQGLPRMHDRPDRLDYAWPTFANIGEQEVYAKELYMNAADPLRVFGYVPRYAEYKFVNSRVAGEMKTSLSFWHLGRIFNDEPNLTEEFVECNPDTRVFAVVDANADNIYAHIFNRISAIRKLPKYGVPQI